MKGERYGFYTLAYVESQAVAGQTWGFIIFVAVLLALLNFGRTSSTKWLDESLSGFNGYLVVDCGVFLGP